MAVPNDQPPNLARAPLRVPARQTNNQQQRGPGLVPGLRERVDVMATCRHPDRDQPKMMCGYPLPCAWHTVIIDASADPPTVTIPITSDAIEVRDRIGDIADAIEDRTK